MIKLSNKVTFVLFAVSLFFIGLGINHLIENIGNSESIFRLISPMVPFIMSAIIFGKQLYFPAKKVAQNL